MPPTPHRSSHLCRRKAETTQLDSRRPSSKTPRRSSFHRKRGNHSLPPPGRVPPRFLCDTANGSQVPTYRGQLDEAAVALVRKCSVDRLPRDLFHHGYILLAYLSLAGQPELGWASRKLFGKSVIMGRSRFRALTGVSPCAEEKRRFHICNLTPPEKDLQNPSQQAVCWSGEGLAR